VASNASISGLVSGLDSATIIDQLMQLEAGPQTRLKARVSTEQVRISALQSINSKTAALATKAAELAKPATWSAVTGTSSNASIGLTTESGASPTRLQVTVTSVARTHQLGFTAPAALTDRVSGASNLVVLDRFDGHPVQLDTGDGTLQGLVNAINDPAHETGLRATAISTTGGYRLLVESTATGAAQDFDLTALDGSPLLGGATVQAGKDAALDLGLGITVSSTTNTFAGTVPGLTMTLAPDTAVGAVSTIEVKRGSDTLKNAVSGLVSAMNTILAEVDSDTAYNTTNKTAGVLAGDSAVRSLRTSLIGTVFSASDSAMAKYGISTTRDGKLVFDSTAFAAAYAADPEGVAARFTSTANGFAARVQTVATVASGANDGTITASITGGRSGISRLQSSITDWDLRLEQRRTTLQRQFTAMETALGQLNSQSSWLSSQLSSLSKSSS
jgi:flagellar hook-associated protein 2